MNRDMLKIIQNVDLQDMEMQIALQCSPLISGIKISNLLIIPSEQLQGVKCILERTTFSYYIINTTSDKATLLLYDEHRINSYLKDWRARNLLRRMGYSDIDLQAVLTQFSQRYRSYMRIKGEFPHEMGVILGYPMEDIEGFIENHGKNFLCIGYWKVYENAPAKKKLFQQYERVTKRNLKMVSHGIHIDEVVRYYAEEPREVV